MAKVPEPAGSRTFGRALLTCLFVLLLGADASALDRDRALGQLHHTAWRARDGAPSQISALAQTADGYLWIGTAKGLFRFDGVRFERYVPPPGVTLPSNNIYTLMATPEGGLWVSFRPSGLGFIKDGQITVLTRAEELPRSQVYCLARDHEGRIWAGTHDGLALLDGSRWLPVERDWNFTPQRIRTLFVDRDGTLWVATDTSLFSLPRGSKAFRDTGTRLTGVVPSLAQAVDGRLWMAETERGARPVTAAEFPGADDPEIRLAAQEVLFDRDGGLWITEADGLRRVRHPERLGGRKVRPGDAWVETYGEGDGLSGDRANNLLEDREGDIWVSTAKGLDRFRYSHLVPVALPHGHQKLTLLAGDGGEVWAGSATLKGLLRIRGEEASVEAAVKEASSVYRDAAGDVWWGCAGGIWRQRGGRFDFFPQPQGTTKDWVWEVFGSDDGGLWVGLGDVGLVHFKDGVWTNRARPAGLPDRVPSASYRDPAGRTWLGYTEDRVYVLDGGRVTAYTREHGIDVGRIRVIRGRGPHFWIGGETGLALFRDGRFHRVRVAGADQFGTVTGIVETEGGDLWLNEMQGVARIPAEEARLAAADPDHAARYQRFDFLDGLRGAPQMNYTASTAVEGSDGRLWFATDNGLVWVDPERMRRNDAPPPVSILSVSDGGVLRPPSDSLTFASGTDGVEIAYTALCLSMPERVQFRYRLEGAEQDWHEAGTRRQAFYTNLGPGRYRFRVIASNNDGVWNEEGAALEFSIAPAFHQTRWFLLLCVAASGGLAWLGYRWRVRSVAARLDLQFQERLLERTRIAQELHDTLLQGFLSASMQLHVADEQLPPDSPAKSQVRRVLELMGQVVEEGRTALRGLRSKDNDALNLEEAFSRVRQELDYQEGVAFRVTAEGRRRPLHPLIRDEVYRIGREALVNAFRHSRAKSVKIEVSYTGERLRVWVSDDGVGIKPEVLKSGREGHWGLSGMRERAERIGARLKVRSRPAAGTEVELLVPGHVAFKPEAPGRAARRFRWPRRGAAETSE